MGALSRPEEVVALVKLRLAAGQIRRQIPPEEHWAFCYSMLQKVSRSFALVIQQLGTQLRNAVSTTQPPSSHHSNDPIPSRLDPKQARRIRFVCSLLLPCSRRCGIRTSLGFRVVSDGRLLRSRRCASSTSCSAPSTPWVSFIESPPNLTLLDVSGILCTVKEIL